MNKCLHNNISKLIKKISNLSRSIIPSEIEEIIKISQPDKPGQNDFSAEFYQILKKESTPILLKLFCKIKTEEKCPNSFYEARIDLILKQHNDQTTKKNYKPISFMDIDEKFSIKYLQN